MNNVIEITKAVPVSIMKGQTADVCKQTLPLVAAANVMQITDAIAEWVALLRKEKKTYPTLESEQ